MLQRYRNGPESWPVGDCYRTVLAYILGCERPYQVPHFTQRSIDWMGRGPRQGLHGGWDTDRLARQWLRERLELDLAHIPLDTIRNWCKDNHVPWLPVAVDVQSRNHPNLSHLIAIDAVTHQTLCDPSPPSDGPHTLDHPDRAAMVITLPYEPDPDTWTTAAVNGTPLGTTDVRPHRPPTHKGQSMNDVHICTGGPRMWERRIVYCPTCDRNRRFVTMHQHWYGTTWTCCACGDSWSDGERLTRPFSPGWRQKAAAVAKKRWAAIPPGRGLYETPGIPTTTYRKARS